MKVIVRLGALFWQRDNLQPFVRCASGGGTPLDGVASRLTC